eukprot:CAMPEP_0171119908 /NCGR_PEP_ID=MMETSP0766_2-20121228/98365_1 /TAXON_ID=439317 /ORGANISM="Gambierdiscus australes, Strain CAWD 149" /LENGTH=81 /DNA_ID=CAMNT_0011582601 /DNA_START=168 /DNA_END=410 /DNA_ORIENTATION=-
MPVVSKLQGTLVVVELHECVAHEALPFAVVRQVQVVPTPLRGPQFHQVFRRGRTRDVTNHHHRGPWSQPTRSTLDLAHQLL